MRRDAQHAGWMARCVGRGELAPFSDTEIAEFERMQRRLLSVTAGDLTHQVAALLLDETGPEPGVVPFAQSTIAQLLGATRPSVNRVLKAMEAAGHLRLGYRRIEVLDPPGLERALR